MRKLWKIVGLLIGVVVIGLAGLYAYLTPDRIGTEFTRTLTFPELKTKSIPLTSSEGAAPSVVIACCNRWPGPPDRWDSAERILRAC